jgi:hypothetical protein
LGARPNPQGPLRGLWVAHILLRSRTTLFASFFWKKKTTTSSVGWFIGPESFSEAEQRFLPEKEDYY